MCLPLSPGTSTAARPSCVSASLHSTTLTAAACSPGRLLLCSLSPLLFTGDGDINIKVAACGICHSDVHLAKAEWGPIMSPFNKPQVSGHEVVGVVTEVGAGVKGIAPGDRVGVGWYKGGCGRCGECWAGRDSTCAASVPVAACGNDGGFSSELRVPAAYAFKIPEGLPSEVAAPLLCGGITVYSPLVDHNLVGKAVGVLGLGGLGSMCVSLAKARGNVVTAISSTPEKEELARRAGATHFINSKDAAQFEAAARTLDAVIVTIPATFDLGAYMTLLKPLGKIIIVGAVPGTLSFPVMPLIMGQLTIAGSVTGGRGRIQELLDFAAAHKVHPIVETFPIADINTALAKVDNNTVRFRAVVTW